MINNPYYLAYAKAHNMTAEVILDRDKTDYPGGCMVPYMIWISERMTVFYTNYPECFYNRHQILDYDAWGKFLEGKHG